MVKNKKDFDLWNTRKKEIHNFGAHKFYRQREIWWCDLGVNVGFEQDGTGREKGIPVLIIRGFSREVCLILPLTTSRKDNRYYYKIGKIDEKEASAIISQIRLLDTKRLVNRIGILNKERFAEIRKAVRNLI